MITHGFRFLQASDSRK
ncbi:MAG TPA: hypothetical protein DCO79_07195 [Spirochaeta sp.]|nr:hypothetical protein [Spirochaeta sp.]